VTLQVRRGNISVTTPGTVLQDLDIYGKVSVSTTDVVIRRCRVRGPSSYSPAGDSSTALIGCTSASIRRLVVEDCHLQPDLPHNSMNGMLGHDFTVRRTRFVNCSDGIGTFNTADRAGPVNVVAEANWLYSLYFVRPSDTGTRAEGTHNDCMQISGGSHYRLVGNRMDAYLNSSIGSAPLDGSAHGSYLTTGNQYFPAMTATSALMVTPNVGPVATLLVDRNWFNGGGTSINFSEKGRGAMQGVVITNNRFGKDQRNPAVQGYIDAATFDAMVCSGNVFDGVSGTPVLKRVRT
jgi:hypothetical protein